MAQKKNHGDTEKTAMDVVFRSRNRSHPGKGISRSGAENAADSRRSVNSSGKELQWQRSITQRRKDAKDTRRFLPWKRAVFGFLESQNEPPCCHAYLPCFFATLRLCVMFLLAWAVTVRAPARPTNNGDSHGGTEAPRKRGHRGQTLCRSLYAYPMADPSVARCTSRASAACTGPSSGRHWPAAVVLATAWSAPP